MGNRGTAVEPPEPQKAHAGICIKRVIGGLEIVFVDFIRNDDKYGLVSGDTMFERVSAAGLVPVEDSGHLEAHRDEWADDPKLAPYSIVTGERHHEDSRHVRCFSLNGRERYWSYLDCRFSRGILVACRPA